MDTVILAGTRLVLHGREPLIGSRSCSETCGLTGVKRCPTCPLLTPHFYVTSHLQRNTNNMLHFYIMHRRQEFAPSTFAFRDVFRRAVDDFVLEASYLYVLTAICKLEQGERAASSFCPALSLVQSYCCPAVRSHSGWVFSDKFAAMWAK